MKKKIILVIVLVFIITISIYLLKNAKIIIIKQKCSYIGKEYCYTYDNLNIHHDKRYYCFYYDKNNNQYICIKNNKKIIYINNIEDLEYLYAAEINCILMDKMNSSLAYDDKNNEINSAILKNKIFPNEESNYWDFELPKEQL